MIERWLSGEQSKTIGIVGTDEFQEALIDKVPEASDWNIVQVLHRSEVQPDNGFLNFNTLYERARAVIEDLPAPPDAIIGHLDFPVTALVSLLCRDYGLTGASPEAVARCEHKLWMRRLQREVLPDETPDFHAINPFSSEAQQSPPLPFPFWLKPVKGHSSMLGFKVREPSDYQQALHACRQAIHRYGEPFNDFLAQLDEDTDCPTDADGNFAIAEELISSDRQFTLEGYVYRGETVGYGAIDSLRMGRHASSFSSYRYPAELPDWVVRRAEEVAGQVLERINFDNGPFNAEFFLDDEREKLRLLEINPRISKSHSPLFHMVDGATHHRQAIQLALGKQPDPPSREGKNRMAAKFMIRSHEADGIVHRVPTEDEIERLRQLLPDLLVQVLIDEGARLSDLADQDSYTYELMDIFLGGNSQEMIEDAHHRCRDSLRFLIQPMPSESRG